MIRPDQVALALLTYETACGHAATLDVRINAMREVLEEFEAAKVGATQVVHENRASGPPAYAFDDTGVRAFGPRPGAADYKESSDE